MIILVYDGYRYHQIKRDVLAMPRKYKLILTLVVVVMALGVGLFLSYQFQSVMEEEDIIEERRQETEEAAEEESAGLNPEEIFYREEEEGGYALSLDIGGERRLLEDDTPSPPSLSPTGRYLAYIAPAEWERVGTLYLYDYVSDGVRTLVEGDDLPDQYTPKELWWLEDDILLFTGGFAYGTVSVGGSLYGVDTAEGKIKTVFPEEERREVKDIEIERERGEIELYIAVFDQDYIDYEVEKEIIEIDEVLAMFN